MTDTTDFPSRGRPRKNLKNYPELMLKTAEEANQLRSEANAIALRRLEVEKKMLMVVATDHKPKVIEKEGERIISQIKRM